MKVFSPLQTEKELPFAELIEALRTAFAKPCSVPVRHVHSPQGLTGQGTTLVMPAWSDSHLGVKVVNIYPNNRRLGLPSLTSVYILFDVNTGEALAAIDGNAITSRRTAAASALAASYLVREEASRMVVIGAGRVGRLIPLAYREVLPLIQVDVWDRTEAVAAEVVKTLRAQGVPATVAKDIRSAVETADIVSCATLSEQPIVQANWLKPGAHLDLIGSFTPEMREAEDECFVDADIHVDTMEALVKSGDLLHPLSTHAISEHDILGTLSDLVQQPKQASRRTGRRTVFKSVGTALEDLAAAVMVLERAKTPLASSR